MGSSNGITWAHRSLCGPCDLCVVVAGVRRRSNSDRGRGGGTGARGDGSMMTADAVFRCCSPLSHWQVATLTAATNLILNPSASGNRRRFPFPVIAQEDGAKFTVRLASVPGVEPSPFSVPLQGKSAPFITQSRDQIWPYRQTNDTPCATNQHSETCLRRRQLHTKRIHVEQNDCSTASQSDSQT